MKRFTSKISILLSVLMLVILFSMGMTANAAPQTRTFTIPEGETNVQIPLTIVAQRDPYAGIEFGLTISEEAALKFVSFQRSPLLTGTQLASGIQNSPFEEKNGVHYFGFFSNSNTFSAGATEVGTLHFEGYTGDEVVTITLSYMEVVRQDANGDVFGQMNDGDVAIFTIRRAGTETEPGANGGGGVTIDIPDSDIPLTEDETETETERELYLDVTDPNAWYYDAIYFVTDNGLMQGTGGNMFSPSIPLTRAMFVTIIGRLAEQRGETITGFSNPFQDVPADTWYTQYVAWAADKGIVQGYSETRFGPTDSVTREQMAALMIRFCDYLDIELGDDIEITFSDADDIGDWAVDSVERAAAVGLMQGSDGRFRPRATSTRAEVAQLFMNFVVAYWDDQSE